MIIINRPQFDDYFMAMAFLASQRSIDPSTKHGCVIVDKNNRIQSLGYNSPPKGCIDSKIPLTRPEKYSFFVHSEESALLCCNHSVEGSTLYVTGRPCHRCLRMILQRGIDRLVYGPVGSNCVDEQDVAASNLMLEGQSIKIDKYESMEFINVLEGTLKYIGSKV
jgi:dCMP deaminase